VRHISASDRNRLSRFWIAPSVCGQTVQGEATETTDLDPVPRRQCLTHMLQHIFNSKSHILYGQVRLLMVKDIDELRSVHAGFREWH